MKWKVSDTDSAHWASSFVLFLFLFFIKMCQWGFRQFFGVQKCKKLSKWMKFFLFSAILERVKYKGNPWPNFLLKGGLDDIYFERVVQIIFWGSRRVKMLKRNEMLFVVSHSEKSNIMWTPIQIFFRKRVYIMFEKGSQSRVQIIFLGQEG